MPSGGSGEQKKDRRYEALILATSALLTLGLGPAFAGTPAPQGQAQQPQQAQRPLNAPLNNQMYPGPEGGQLAQQQQRPLNAPLFRNNEMYPGPEGGQLALQQPAIEQAGWGNWQSPVPEGGCK